MPPQSPRPPATRRAACVLLAVDREYDLTLLRLRRRAAHRDFERARVDGRELCALDEYVLGCGIADVVEDELRLRRRFEIREPQRRARSAAGPR